MGIEIPTELQWVAKYVVGAGDWPKGDETAMRRLAHGWDQLADALTEIQTDAGSVTTSALAAVDGKTHEAIKEFWDQVAGDKGLWPGLIEEVKGLSKDLDDTATDIEHTKYVIIATLVIFAIQMIQAIATACTGIGAPAAAAEEAAAQVAARLTIRQIIKWLIQKISTRALAKAAIIGVAQGAGVDAGASLLQMAQGKRGGFTGEEVKGLFAESVSGAVGGAVGAKLGSDGLAKGLVDKAGSTAGKFAARTAADAVGGAAGSVAGTAASVPFGGKFEVDPTTLATSSVAGAAQGALGQVHEGRTTPASHESGTTDAGDSGSSSSAAGQSHSTDNSTGTHSGNETSPAQPSPAHDNTAAPSTAHDSAPTGPAPAGDTDAQPSPHTSSPAPAGTETGTTSHSNDAAPAPDHTTQPGNGNGLPEHTESAAPQHNTAPTDAPQASHTPTTETAPSGHPTPAEHSVPEQPHTGSSLNWDTDSPSPSETGSTAHDSSGATNHPAPHDTSNPANDAPATSQPAGPGHTAPQHPDSAPANTPAQHDVAPAAPAASPHPDAGAPVHHDESPAPQPDSQAGPAHPTATPHKSSVDPAASPQPVGDRAPTPADTAPATTHAATADSPTAATPSAAPSMGSMGSLGSSGGEGTHRSSTPAHTPIHPETPHSGPDTASRPDSSRSPRENVRTETPPASRPESPRPAPSTPTTQGTTARPEPGRHTPGSTAAGHSSARPGPESTPPPARTPEPNRPQTPHVRNEHAQNKPTGERPPGAAASRSETQAPNGTRPESPVPADASGRRSEHSDRPGAADDPSRATGEHRLSDDSTAAPHNHSDPEPAEVPRTGTDGSAEAEPPTAPSQPPHRPGFDPAIHNYVARHNDGRMIHMDPFYSGRYNPHIDRYQPTPEEISAARAHPPGESPHDVEVRRWEEHRAGAAEAPAAQEQSPARTPEHEAPTARDSSPENTARPERPAERTPTPSDRAGTPHDGNTPPHNRTGTPHDHPANAPEHPAAERPETPPLRREPELATPPRWAHHDPNFLANSMRPPEFMRRGASHPANGHPHPASHPETRGSTDRPNNPRAPHPNRSHPETPRPETPRPSRVHPETHGPTHPVGHPAQEQAPHANPSRPSPHPRHTDPSTQHPAPHQAAGTPPQHSHPAPDRRNRTAWRRLLGTLGIGRNEHGASPGSHGPHAPSETGTRHDLNTNQHPGHPVPADGWFTQHGGDLNHPLATTRMMDQYVGEQIPGRRWPTGVWYYDDVGRQQFRLRIHEGRIYDAQGRLFDTRSGVSVWNGQGNAIFVMDEHGNLYASLFQQPGVFHHSSFLAGAPVAGAGELVVINGELQLITDSSGHYRPGHDYTLQVVDRLRAMGVPITRDQIRLTPGAS
ncbi:hypothetical protein [Nocardia sp. AB354]|uniref:WXG100-like domain-containing protein n=1 Tax=Nocardia sp. AB354 TaxID=3413283 RepID=UPI003C1FBA04